MSVKMNTIDTRKNENTLLIFFEYKTAERTIKIMFIHIMSGSKQMSLFPRNFIYRYCRQLVIITFIYCFILNTYILALIVARLLFIIKYTSSW